ncbi:hypothetical protein KY289_008646 [Solanum tuberosum]|nr:hypothetical protein KY289_008646 [Solanum tuberosum]
MIYIPLVPITVNRFASLHNPDDVYLKPDYLPHFEDDAGDPESRHKGMLETENLVNELKKYAVTISWEGMCHIRDANQEGGVVAFTGATISTDADLLA